MHNLLTPRRAEAWRATQRPHAHPRPTPRKHSRPGLGWLLLMVLATLLLTDAERGEPTPPLAPASAHRRAETLLLLGMAAVLAVAALCR